MKNCNWKMIVIAPALIAAMTACASPENGNRTIIKENGNSIVVLDPTNNETGKPAISVSRIERLDNVNVAAWLNEETLVVSKDNELLDKMKLAELSDLYPKSLYLLHLGTKSFDLLKEKENTFLGEASLSPDKQHLLYSEYTLGDPAYYVLNMDTLESFKLQRDDRYDAMGARWSDDNVIVGAAYSGGAYMAAVDGKATAIEGLAEGSFVIVAKAGNTVYYNTAADPTLMAYDLNTKQSESTNLTHVRHLLIAPDGKQLLVAQYNETGTKMSLLLSDLDGGNSQKLAEGTEITGVSWSPDQRMIAYQLKEDSNKGLYIYDLLAGKSIQIALDVDQAVTSWSPSGNKLAFSEWDGKQHNSRIAHLAYSLEK